MSRPRECGCDPEAIFELVDGALREEREREVRAHLHNCPECRELHHKELNVSAYLGSVEFAEARSHSVCQSVAMVLPTRPLKVRLLWATLALALFFTAALALSLDGAAPAAFAVNAVQAFLGFASGFAAVVRNALAAVGSLLLGALVVGALLDLFIAAALILLSRRRASQA